MPTRHACARASRARQHYCESVISVGFLHDARHLTAEECCARCEDREVRAAAYFAAVLNAEHGDLAATGETARARPTPCAHSPHPSPVSTAPPPSKPTTNAETAPPSQRRTLPPLESFQVISQRKAALRRPDGRVELGVARAADGRRVSRRV